MTMDIWHMTIKSLICCKKSLFLRYFNRYRWSKCQFREVLHSSLGLNCYSLSKILSSNHFFRTLPFTRERQDLKCHYQLPDTISLWRYLIYPKSLTHISSHVCVSFWILVFPIIIFINAVTNIGSEYKASCLIQLVGFGKEGALQLGSLLRQTSTVLMITININNAIHTTRACLSMICTSTNRWCWHAILIDQDNNY